MQAEGFQDTDPIERPELNARPQHDQRRHDERTGDVAQPPGERDGRELGEFRRTGQNETADAGGGADHGAGPEAKQCEFRNVLGAVEGAVEGKRQLHDPEVGGEMPAGFGRLFDQEGTDFGGELRKL